VSIFLFLVFFFTDCLAVQYDGEKDTRAPHDFANNANAKLNNDADADDDDVDDDDDPDSTPIRGNRKRHEPKLKAEYANSSKLLVPSSGGDMGLNVDVRYSLVLPLLFYSA
jgi:MADS-box transcription factor